MSSLWILSVSAILLIAAYIFYGRGLERRWGIDPAAPTPACALRDGVDYVPARASVVFGHEFASIAGAGPINGPILAAMFGWAPVLLWILLGGIFFGAVQDFAAMYASVKNKGKTIGYIIEQYIGKTGKRLFLVFVWFFSILVVAAFADIVAATFNGFDANGGRIPANAAVASTSALFVAAALGLGLFLHRRKPGNLTGSLVAIALLCLCIFLGMTFPGYLPQSTWLYLVFAYIFAASITPVWILLQPRDFLNSFLLMAMMLAAFVGVVTAGPEMNLQPFTGFVVDGVPLFPILFVTVACGAVSGFHSLVASGTASKQIENERHMLPISFGAMLLECFLAVLALIAVGWLAVGGNAPEGAPPVIFATAIAQFLGNLGISYELAYTLITLAVSAFALTSLDSVARVGRVAFQELFTDSEADPGKLAPLSALLANRYTATALTLLMGYLLAMRGYKDIWALFGSANQLLAALSLTACAVFLKKTGRAHKMLLFPMAAMLLITFTALGLTIHSLLVKLLFGGDFAPMSDGLQLAFAVLLLALGVLVALAGIKKLAGGRKKAPDLPETEAISV